MLWVERHDSCQTNVTNSPSFNGSQTRTRLLNWARKSICYNELCFLHPPCNGIWRKWLKLVINYITHCHFRNGAWFGRNHSDATFLRLASAVCNSFSSTNSLQLENHNFWAETSDFLTLHIIAGNNFLQTMSLGKMSRTCLLFTFLLGLHWTLNLDQTWTLTINTIWHLHIASQSRCCGHRRGYPPSRRSTGWGRCTSPVPPGSSGSSEKSWD